MLILWFVNIVFISFMVRSFYMDVDILKFNLSFLNVWVKISKILKCLNVRDFLFLFLKSKYGYKLRVKLYVVCVIFIIWIK